MSRLTPRQAGAPEPVEAPDVPEVLEAEDAEAGRALHNEAFWGAGLDRAYAMRRRAGALGVGVLVLGFLGGYGVGYGVRKRDVRQAAQSQAPRAAPVAPIVKAMRMSPDGRLLAFTAVYDQSRRSSRFVLDVATGRFSAADAPVGWQDFVVSWDKSGRSILLKRDRIPPPVAEAKAGFYTQRLLAGSWPRFEPEVGPLDPELPPGDKSVSGFWDARDRLVIKTRREPKSLFVEGRRLDSSPELYLQNRTLRENGRDVLYVVRNSTSDVTSPPALFRVENGRARRLSEDLEDLEWAYIAESGGWMIAARYAANNTDWLWSLYQVTPQRALKVREEVIPGDAIGVAWSPDKRKVLGLNGRSLWLIDIPTLAFRPLGGKRVANSDDATWSTDSKSVFVAVDGKIFQVDAATGTVTEKWKFPDAYWD